MYRGDLAAGLERPPAQERVLQAHVDGHDAPVLGEPLAQHPVQVRMRKGRGDERAGEPFVPAHVVVHVMAGEVSADRGEAIPRIECARTPPGRDALPRLQRVDVGSHRYLTKMVSRRLIHSSRWLTKSTEIVV